MFVLLVYAIIPKLPLSGALLDSSQSMYVNKLFGANSPFVNGILYITSLIFIICSIVYGTVTKQIKNGKDTDRR